MKERVNLTIRLEDLERARAYADKLGKSLSEMTEELYQSLDSTASGMSFSEFIKEDRRRYPDRQPTEGRDFKQEYRESAGRKHGR